jgi:hypothetical protein
MFSAFQRREHLYCPEGIIGHLFLKKKNQIRETHAALHRSNSSDTF